ncbi:MAG: plastocyanin/azurin family copper-binding protein [Candidatus Aenigmatarchaeota archaeon]
MKTKKIVPILIIAAIGLIALSSLYFQNKGNDTTNIRCALIDCLEGYDVDPVTCKCVPATTSAECNAGDVKKYDCPDGTKVNWCQCVNQRFACIISPDVGCQSSTVKIKNFAFTPNILVIKKGMTVTWSNEDSTPHQIASDPHPTHTDLPELVSGILSNGQNYSFTFTKTGTFGYHCHLHPSMKGTIVVQ